MPKYQEFFIWFPKPYTPARTILINSVDVTDDVWTMEFNKPATYQVGLFNVTLKNPFGRNSNRFTKGQTVEIQLDNSAGTTTFFKGYIEGLEEIRDGGNFLAITGKHISRALAETYVTATFTDQLHSNILINLMANHIDGFTSANVRATTTSGTFKWENTPMIQCISDVCNQGGLDAYADNNLDLNAFVRGSITNTQDAIVYGDTMANDGLKNFGINVSASRDYVKIVGKDKTGNPVLWVAGSGSREKAVNNTSIENPTQASNEANLQLENNSGIDNMGRAKSKLLMNTNPGDMIYISDPEKGIIALYRVVNLKYVWNRTERYTETTVEREPKEDIQLIRDIIRRTSEAVKIDNPNGMLYSQNFDFDTDTGTHSNTSIANSELRISSGSSGVWTSPSLTLPEDINQAELRLTGADLSSSAVSISLDGGTTYQTIEKDTLTSITLPGSSLIVRVTLTADSNNPVPIVEGLAVLMKP